MQKRKIILIVASLIIVAATAFLGYFFSPQRKERFVKQKIAEANYCKTDSDCTYIMSKCPFDCYIYLNKSKKDEINALISSYISKCAYGCVSITGVGCKNNKCKPIF